MSCTLVIMKRILFIFALLLMSVPVLAQDATLVSNPQSHLSGRDLMNFCKGQYDIDFGYCAGYMAAISEVMQDHSVYGQSACNHSAVAPQQLVELLKENAKRNPSLELQPASVAAAQTLSGSFRCR
ncbi:MAG: Rap1a/Tai family immunity protein [Pseudomonadota bacterium]